MKTNEILITGLLILICVGNNFEVLAQKNENTPLPQKYLNEIDKIYLHENIELKNSQLIISAYAYGAGFILQKAAQNQQKIKAQKVAKSEVMKNDSSVLVNAIYKTVVDKFQTVCTKMSPNLDKASYILKFKIENHGFNWASSSAAGMFIDLKAELLSKNGELLWEQVYYMDKTESKQTHKRGAMTMNKCIDKILADFKKKPQLLGQNYELISAMLVNKVFK